MRLVAFIQMFNEVKKGNLERCLNNCKRWADDIVIYDDASTDNSIEVATRYTRHTIRGAENCINRELFHKQQLLEYAIKECSPDWIFWIDCDEIVDRLGSNGGLRELCEYGTRNKFDAFSFHQVNLWRSQTYYRLDSLFDYGWFVRLWRVVPGIRIEASEGVHKRLYPITIEKMDRCPAIQVIHYGFWNYLDMLVKIGAHLWERKDWDTKAKDNWILNETDCSCKKVPLEWFPEENIPVGEWPEPKIKSIAELKTYEELLCMK